MAEKTHDTIIGLEFLEDVEIGRDAKLTSSGLVRTLTEFLLGVMPDDELSAERAKKQWEIPSHPDWCESLAVTIIGMLMGRDRYIQNKFGKILANIFCIIVGGSGISFKTVPLPVIREFLDRLSAAVNEDICQNAGTTMLQYQESLLESKRTSNRTKGTNAWKTQKWALEAIGNKFVSFKGLEKFTGEALISYLTKFPQNMIVGDEFTKMFKGSRTKDHMNDNMEDMSRLWDAMIEKVATQARGVEYPENAFVAFCSATTYYLLLLLDESFFMQGTGNRILWILDEDILYVDVEDTAQSMKFFWSVDNETAYNNAIDKFTQELMNIRYLPKGLVEVSMGAGVMLDRYRLHMHNRAVDVHQDDLLNVDANYIIRLAQNAMKLALAHCAGRYAEDPRGLTMTRLVVSMEDAQWAIMKMEKHYYYYQRLWAIAGRIRKGTVKDYKDDFSRVLFLIDRLSARGNRLSGVKLRQNTGWLRDDCSKILDTLIANGEVEARVYTDRMNVKRGFYTRPDWDEDLDRKWCTDRGGVYQGKLTKD